MYAGLRHGLVLSSRTAEACYSRRRRLPVSLVRCRSYEAVERRLDGEAEHGLDDEKQPPLGGHTPTARDEHYQLPQERDERTPRKAYQNGRSYNGANADGGAAPATPLPWDVLGRAQFTESRSRSMKLPWHSSREDDHSFVSSTGAFTEKTNGSGAVPPPLLPSFPFDSPARIPVAPWMASATRNNNSKGQNASKPRVAWLEQDDDGALDFGGNEGAAAACGRHGLTNSVNGSEQDEVNPFGLPIRRQVRVAVELGFILSRVSRAELEVVLRAGCFFQSWMIRSNYKYGGDNVESLLQQSDVFSSLFQSAPAF